MQLGNLKYLYRNELNKACFAHDAAYSDSTYLTKRTQSDNILYEIANNPKCDGYQRGLASMVHKFFDKKSKGSGVNLCQISNLLMSFIKQLLESLKKEKYILLLRIISGVLI